MCDRDRNRIDRYTPCGDSRHVEGGPSRVGACRCDTANENGPPAYGISYAGGPSLNRATVCLVQAALGAFGEKMCTLAPIGVFLKIQIASLSLRMFTHPWLDAA